MSEAAIHALSLCESEVGVGTSVGAFTHVHPGVAVGADCLLGEGAVIETGAVIGDRVQVGAGTVVAGHVEIEDDARVGAGATFATESDQLAVAESRSFVRGGVTIGAGSTVLPGVEIGRNAIVAPGSVVTRSVPPYAVASGNPCQVQRYQDSDDGAVTPTTTDSGPLVRLGVRGVQVQQSPEFADERGSLAAGEMPGGAVPFVPRRWFVVYGVPSRELRGEHAHRECHQFLMCLAGSVVVAVDDGENRAEVVLDSPTKGVYIPPMVWGSQFRYEPETVLLVLASHPYDASDYIRNYEDYLRIISI